MDDYDMKPTDSEFAMKRLLCFAEGKEGDWEGFCLDLDIAVQGQSFAEVCRLLEDSIEDYVKAALEEKPETRVKLLNRRAPLHIRWAYTLRFLLAMLRQNNDKLTHGFTAQRGLSAGHCGT